MGLVPLDLKSVIDPCYTFSYTSSGGNSGLNYTIELSISTLRDFINWLDDKIKYKKSAQYQRIIMTPEFRNKIKKRDNYTCQKCGVSVKDEPTLLLEVDHIIPISKGENQLKRTYNAYVGNVTVVKVQKYMKIQKKN